MTSRTADLSVTLVAFIARATVTLLLAASLTACRKAGTGGAASVVCSVSHHGRPIPGAIIHVKFGASESPGSDTGAYDLHIETGRGETAGQGTVTGLKPGKYYFFATGFDSAISESVKGGLPLTIGTRDRKGNISVGIPVSE